jgi:glycosyltransferase involved in cell wall biosynthesis
MRIAVSDQRSDRWSAGATYTETMLRSLRAVCGDTTGLAVLTAGDAARFNGLARVVHLAPQARSVARLRSRTPLPFFKDRTESFCDRHRVDALLLASDLRPGSRRYTRIAWIPDFQHKHLPHYFTAAEIAFRDALFARTTRLSDTVLLSSNTALHDYQRFFPGDAAKGLVARFPSLYALTEKEQEAEDVTGFYHIPGTYILVANQYWAHKNHAIVVEALAHLRKRGCTIPAVFIGLPADYRDPVNGPTSRILQLIASRGLAGQIIPLGLVPRPHLTALIRHAGLIVQPSEFEGWNTSIQDARTFGKALLCSDIPVHREQAPDALGFFPPHDAQALAAILRDLWSTVRAGIDPVAEQAGLQEQRDLAMSFGRLVLQACRA